MKVSACLVSRGDVDMQPVLDSLPEEWEVVLWDNSGYVGRSASVWGPGLTARAPDLSVYGRYAAIEYASHDLIYVQDDDCIVSDPQAIVNAWINLATCNGPRDCVGTKRGCVHCYPTIQESVVCNMSQVFRPHYPDSGLVGFGACFHRDAPRRAFDRWWSDYGERGFFHRRADNWFTTLTPRILVDVPKTDREMASDPNRMWRQPGHESEKQRMIELARRVRDSV